MTSEGAALRTISTAVVSGLMAGTRVNMVSEIEPFRVFRCRVAQSGRNGYLRDVDTGTRWKIRTYATFHYELPYEGR